MTSRKWPATRTQWVAIPLAAVIFLAAGCGWELESQLSCGDGKIATDEDCDGANFGGQSCKTLGYQGGELACTAGCKLDRSGCFSCGDGRRSAAEPCDDGDLANKKCKDFKAKAGRSYSGGTLACKKDCSDFDFSGCVVCGDSKKNGSEACDNKDLAQKTCKTLYYDGGKLACKKDCSWFDTTGCYRCGDGKKNGSEACDGKDLDGKTCKALKHDGGTLGCAKDCTWNEAGCYKCGDGKKNGGEKCDAKNLDGKSCTDFKTVGGIPYSGGKLACRSDCTDFELKGCFFCNDGTKNGMEVCDGKDTGGQSCKTLKFDGGKLHCKKDCSGFDATGCFKCGDNTKNGKEHCDGSDLGQGDCKKQGFEGGQLKCKKDCSWYDESDCYKCGDNKISGSDICDGTDLSKKTCKNLGFEGGQLKCKSDCSWYDTGGCYKCGDGKKNGTEQCDGIQLGGAKCEKLDYLTGKLNCTDNCYVTGTPACKKDCTFDSSGCKPYKWDWVLQGGGKGEEKLVGVISLEHGAYNYLAGTFENGDATFGSFTLTWHMGKGKSIFISRVNDKGQYSWANSTTGTGDLTLLTPGFDGGNNLYLYGRYTGKPTFGKDTLADSATGRIFVAKADKNGKWLWAKDFVGNPTNMTVHWTGNIYLTGSHSGAVPGGTATAQGGLDDVFVVKLDTNGKFQWAESFGGPGNDQGLALGLSETKNPPKKLMLYVAGSYRDTVKIANSSLPVPKTAGQKAAFVVQIELGSTRKINWATGFLDADVSTVVGDDDGSVVLLGRFKPSLTLGKLKKMTYLKDFAGADQGDYYVARIKSGKIWDWSFALKSKFPMEQAYLSVGRKGEFFFTLTFDSILSLGKSIFTGGKREILVANVKSGAIQWATTAGGPLDDKATALAYGMQNHLIIAGWCGDQAKFGPTTLTVAGSGSDIFIGRLQVKP